jgi:predicted TIM-barrel fold metal-dependent hydrolase
MIINSHIHTFHGVKDTPNKLFGAIPTWLLKKGESWECIRGILHALNPFSDKDELDRLVNFGSIGRLENQQAIFEECFKSYPIDTMFCLLTMDMAFMGAGKVPRPYEQQLIEVYNLKKKYPKNIIPFIHIDCRRENHFELFKQAIEQWGFNGMKMYPPYGTFPYDKRYDVEYSYCETHNIPIIAHCTQDSTMYYKGKRKDLTALLSGCKLDIDWTRTNKQLCDYFTHPTNYRWVFDRFPNLKISLAHIGRGNNWDKIIMDMMKEFPNLYTDCSYTMYNEDGWYNLKLNLITNDVFRNRCLFGSDFFMNAVECNEEYFSKKFRVFLGEELWKIISYDNPKRFLSLQ